MNLDYLHTLVSVVEHGSLSAAARAKRISQPAVTKQIQRMESELGLTLLVRGPKRQVELTPAGERVVAFARETLAGYEALEQELGVIKEVGQGTLVLAASTIPGEYILPALLAAFREEYPRIRVEMTISDTADVAKRLLEDTADVGMVGSKPRRPGLRLERLVEDEVVLAVPPGHALAQQESARAEDLQGQRLVLREEGSGTRRSVEQALAASGMALRDEDVALILGSSQAVLQAVEQGLGIGFVSARAAAAARADGRVACVALEGVDLARALYLAYIPERAGDPLVGRFLKFARERSA
ncbi:MAG TPA: LysR family transcriptional regulator, partial [Chloroflexi bacterium]|nr:LysR family transcriptional regulator [Chloroflexota bacterium]